MGFRECSLLSQREEFCRLALADGANMRELCRRFGVSPTSGYKWRARFEAQGSEGLKDLSRRPLTSPARTTAELEAQVLEVRQAHPTWGGRKISKVLRNRGVAGPAASTVTDILRRHGQLDGPGAGREIGCTRFEHPAPNDLWQMDFKGHFATDAGRCHPLTVLDDHSRYALEVGACADETGKTVRQRLEQVFERYGLPRRMLADNGSPWGAPSSVDSFSALSVWLMDLGVWLSHGRPYHPQTQGKDERFHRTLKGDAIDGRRFRDMEEAQAAFDRFRQTYNYDRPHDGIGLKVPASRYQMSPRKPPKQIDPPDYEPQAKVRKVQKGGVLHFNGRQLRVSCAFVGRPLALRATATDDLYDLCYRSFRLAKVDLRQADDCVHHVPAQASTLTPV